MVIGLDIGTTALGIAAVDIGRHAICATQSEDHNAALTAENSDEHCQDVDRLCNLALAQLDAFEARFGRPQAIAVSGQMHGILYMDRDGRARSPLYTWMDRRADRVHAAGRHAHKPPIDGTFLAEIDARSGWRLAAGYGLATHYANRALGVVPEGAYSIGTIMDYLSMRLCRQRLPISDPSCAASIGLYQGARGFDRVALQALEIDQICLPTIAPSASVIGTRADGVPIVAPIGDNQAGFIGAVADPDRALLVNIGTSAQVSAAVPAANVGTTDAGTTDADLEVRPFVDNRRLLVGSLLAGGKALEMLADLFAEAYMLYSGRRPDDKYGFLQRLANIPTPPAHKRLRVDAHFAGSRSEPQRRGVIGAIGLDNFTVAELTRSCMAGVADDLYDLWCRMSPAAPFVPECIACSGAGISRNRIMQGAIAERWGMPLRIPLHSAEAAVGAALVAAVGIGASWHEAGTVIRYREAC